MPGGQGRSRPTPPAASAEAAVLPTPVAKFGVASKFFSHIYYKLEVPATEIIVHLILTILAVLSITLIELLLRLLVLDEREIPWTHLKLSDWFFYLDFLAATPMISIGVVKAVIATWRAP
jgi:hypothetical protein